VHSPFLQLPKQWHQHSADLPRGLRRSWTGDNVLRRVDVSDLLGHDRNPARGALAARQYMNAAEE